MATQHDLSEVIAFLDEGHEYVGIKSERHPEGKTYRVPPPNAQTGLWLSTLAELGTVAASGGNLSAQDVADLTLDDDEEKPFYRRVLGPAYDEMVADKVPVEFVTRAFLTALADFQTGREMAEVTWEAGLDPEAVAALLTQRIQARAAQDEASSSTDEATTTP